MENSLIGRQDDMAFCYSPSNMMIYRQCPLKFFGQSIEKSIKWRASVQKSRGTVIHSQIEKCMRLGMQENITWDDKIDLGYTRGVIERVRHAIAQGYKLTTEAELVATKEGKVASWWDDNAFLRSKADVLLVHPDPSMPVIIGDIKTGRIYDKEDFQLLTEAFLAHLVCQRPLISYAYWYVDQGEDVDGTINFNNGLQPVQIILDTLSDMQKAIKNNDFPPKKNALCRWCQWHKTEHCNV